jgi:hypothetical protein
LKEHLKAGPFISKSVVDKLRVDPGEGREHRQLSMAKEFMATVDLNPDISKKISLSDVRIIYYSYLFQCCL